MSQLDIIIKKYDKSLLWLIVVLCGIGTVMLYSASSFKSLYQTSGLTDTIYLQSHLKKMMIGFFGMFLFTVMDYRKLKIAAPYILILSIILLIPSTTVSPTSFAYFNAICSVVPRASASALISLLAR